MSSSSRSSRRACRRKLASGVSTSRVRFAPKRSRLQLGERIRKLQRAEAAITSGRRFISKDPVRFGGGFNLYGYVHNDPINFFDRTGRGEEAFQDFFNKFWQWFNQLPAPAKGAVAAAAVNAAAPYVAGLCLASPLVLTSADTPIEDTKAPPIPWSGPDTGKQEICDLIPETSGDCKYQCRVSGALIRIPKDAQNDNGCLSTILNPL
jgi:hypothetical protein